MPKSRLLEKLRKGYKFRTEQLVKLNGKLGFIIQTGRDAITGEHAYKVQFIDGTKWCKEKDLTV